MEFLGESESESKSYGLRWETARGVPREETTKKPELGKENEGAPLATASGPTENRAYLLIEENDFDYQKEKLRIRKSARKNMLFNLKKVKELKEQKWSS